MLADLLQCWQTMYKHANCEVLGRPVGLMPIWCAADRSLCRSQSSQETEFYAIVFVNGELSKGCSAYFQPIQPSTQLSIVWALHVFVNTFTPLALVFTFADTWKGRVVQHRKRTADPGATQSVAVCGKRAARGRPRAASRQRSLILCWTQLAGRRGAGSNVDVPASKHV